MKRNPPKSIVINGKRISLKPDGKSGGGYRKLRAASAIPGLGRLFINVYLEDPKNPRAHRRTPAPKPPVAAKPPKVPAPAMLAEIQAKTLDVLQTMTARLNALELAVPVRNGHHRRPVPQPSA